jgi:parallel beta-helix repeat protein
MVNGAPKANLCLSREPTQGVILGGSIGSSASSAEWCGVVLPDENDSPQVSGTGSHEREPNSHRYQTASRRDHRSESNNVAGIALNGASNNLVEKNEVFRNGQDGIRLLNNADQNIVQLNHVLRHGRDGIRADAATTGNTIAQNLMRDNNEHDAHDDSVGAGTAGTANFGLKNNCKTENRPGLCEHTGGAAAKR